MDLKAFGDEHRFSKIRSTEMVMFAAEFRAAKKSHRLFADPLISLLLLGCLSGRDSQRQKYRDMRHALATAFPPIG